MLGAAEEERKQKGLNSLQLPSCHGMPDLVESLKKKNLLVMDYGLSITILKYSHC